jgi:hypothetical protein
MTRIAGVPRGQASPIVRMAYRFGPRMMKKLAGREPSIGSGIEPMEIWAYQPKMMMGMGRFNTAARARCSPTVRRLRSTTRSR